MACAWTVRGVGVDREVLGERAIFRPRGRQGRSFSLVFGYVFGYCDCYHLVFAAVRDVVDRESGLRDVSYDAVDVRYQEDVSDGGRPVGPAFFDSSGVCVDLEVAFSRTRTFL